MISFNLVTPLNSCILRSRVLELQCWNSGGHNSAVTITIFQGLCGMLRSGPRAETECWVQAGG